MNNTHKGFVGVLAVVGIVVVVAGVSLLLYRTRPPETGRGYVPNPIASSTSSSAIVITNSGSTNTAGFVITVNPDGSGTFDLHQSRTAPESIKNIPVGTFEYHALEQSILAVPSLSFSGMCAKSASFGTTEKLLYNGTLSGDLTCPPNTPVYQVLTATVGAIITEARN